MKTALVTFLFATLPAAADVAQEAYLKASNTDSDHDNETVQYYEDLAELTGTSIGIDFGEQFGSVVAVSGDTAVVGAPREHSGSAGVNGDQSDDSLLDAGAAYVLIRIGTTWVQQAYLKASNPIEGAAFGTSVAIDGDTIVVGAPGEDGGSSGVNGDESDQSAASSGAAYVFVRSGTTWSQEAYLKASNPDSDDNFGSAVAIDGDRIVVGAPHEDSAIGGIGAN